ncbi:MAG TPA: YcnI family protein [Acidimicrobiales bacterium]|nr:YcnI family protein [Acidimicrobiales bacterium]
MRRLLLLPLAALALLGLAGPAAAHVTVDPGEATKGGFSKLAFRVPNERDAASTTKVEIAFPPAHGIEHVSVRPLPGWTVNVTKAGDAVERITWSGGSIAAGEFQEFEVSVGPLPEDKDALVFKALQTYSDGEVVRWIDEPVPGGAEAEHPAPVLTLVGEAATATTVSAAAVTPADDEGANGNDSTGVALAALGASVLALMLGAFALVRNRPAE